MNFKNSFVERVYLMDGQRCGRLSTITLTMFATNFRSGWSLQCCAGKPAHQSACTDEVLVKVECKYLARENLGKINYIPGSQFVPSRGRLEARGRKT